MKLSSHFFFPKFLTIMLLLFLRCILLYVCMHIFSCTFLELLSILSHICCVLVVFIAFSIHFYNVEIFISKSSHDHILHSGYHRPTCAALVQLLLYLSPFFCCDFFLFLWLTLLCGAVIVVVAENFQSFFIYFFFLIFKVTSESSWLVIFWCTALFWKGHN